VNLTLEEIIKSRGGHYCHAFEVHDSLELEFLLQNLYDEFIEDYIIEEIVEFCRSAELYCLEDEHQEEVFNFNIEEYLRGL